MEIASLYARAHHPPGIIATIQMLLKRANCADNASFGSPLYAADIRPFIRTRATVVDGRDGFDGVQGIT